MTWTYFHDSHSGGTSAPPGHESVFIEAPKDDAIAEFIRRYNYDPETVTCQCCGPDYTILTLGDGRSPEDTDANTDHWGVDVIEADMIETDQ